MLAALMVIDCSVAAVTVSTSVFEVTPLWVAVMLVELPILPVARPLALMVAADAFEEAQATEVVRFWVLPSLKLPVAVDWEVVAFAIEALAALMLIDCSVAAVTVSTSVLEVTPLCVAVMLVEPTPVPVARPLALMVAADAFEEAQATEVVRFWVLPSLKVPVAVN